MLPYHELPSTHIIENNLPCFREGNNKRNYFQKKNNNPGKIPQKPRKFQKHITKISAFGRFFQNNPPPCFRLENNKWDYFQEGYFQGYGLISSDDASTNAGIAAEASVTVMVQFSNGKPEEDWTTRLGTNFDDVSGDPADLFRIVCDTSSSPVRVAMFFKGFPHPHIFFTT